LLKKAVEAIFEAIFEVIFRAEFHGESKSQVRISKNNHDYLRHIEHLGPEPA
jgi:hypothetical protein